MYFCFCELYNFFLITVTKFRYYGSKKRIRNLVSSITYGIMHACTLHVKKRTQKQKEKNVFLFLFPSVCGSVFVWLFFFYM